MKAYVPFCPLHAGHWIYKGYASAWESAGLEVVCTQAPTAPAILSQIPMTREQLGEEYVIMTTDDLVQMESRKYFDAINKSLKTFVFAQPNTFPHPWGTHPNFRSSASPEVIETLNDMDNVYLWTFTDADPKYYNQWKKVHTIPLAYDSIGYKHISDEKCKKFDISFVGGWANNGFNEKRKIMIDIFSKFMDSGLKCGFFVNKNLTHEQECKVLHNSRVTLNVHDAYQRALGLDTNERTFKSLGLNGCLVSDTVGQLNNLFPTVKTSLESEELVQITKDYLSLTDAELNVIKEENRQLILDKHCYTNRVKALMAL
jgi:hypothetical protein